MKVRSTLIFAFAIFSAAANAETQVNGYYRSNGTYVAPHYRSSPDSSYNNNWSTSPNVNPHTGSVGTNEPRYENYDSSNQRSNNSSTYGNMRSNLNSGYGRF